jgi:hypothetical protein
MMENTLLAMKQAVDQLEIVTNSDGSRKYRITIHTEHEPVALMVEVVHMLVGISDQLYRSVKNTASQDRADRTLGVIQAQQRLIADLYQEYRATGLKHREAIERVTHSPIAEKMRYDRAAVAVCVRTYQAEAPTLDQPTTKEVSRA